MVRLLAWKVVVIPEDIEARATAAQDIVPEVHMVDLRPRGRPVLVPHREEDGEPALSVGPILFEDISLDEHRAGVLQLE